MTGLQKDFNPYQSPSIEQKPKPKYNIVAVEDELAKDPKLIKSFLKQLLILSIVYFFAIIIIETLQYFFP